MLYDKVIETYYSNDANAFTAAARNWVEGNEKLPFNDPEAVELFRRAKRYCSIWRSNAINSRVSKLRMVECIRQIVELNPQRKVKEASNPIEKELPKEPVKVLGVIPETEVEEQHKHIFGRRKKR